jgi:hypothetical protein
MLISQICLAATKDCLISQDVSLTPQKNWLISQKSGYHRRMPHFNEASVTTTKVSNHFTKPNFNRHKQFSEFHKGKSGCHKIIIIS